MGYCVALSKTRWIEKVKYPTVKALQTQRLVKYDAIFASVSDPNIIIGFRQTRHRNECVLLVYKGFCCLNVELGLWSDGLWVFVDAWQTRFH